MTGNNKFWRASLAGLASVAMLATMGVAASTANAAGTPTATETTNFSVKVYRADNPGVASFAGSAAKHYGDVFDLSSITTNPYAGTSDHKILTGYSYDLAGKNLAAGTVAVKGDTKLYAQYAAASNVTFVGAGTIEVKTGSPITAADYAGVTEPTAPAGKVFAGWKYTDSADAQDLYTNQPVTKDITLYPVFEDPSKYVPGIEENVSKVDFHLSDSTTTESLYTLANRPFPEFRTAALSSAFDGVEQWSASKDNSSAYDFTAKVPNQSATPDAADLTLYGFGSFGDKNWTINYVFDVNPHQSVTPTASTTQYAAEGSKISQPNDPAEWGAQFTGWYTENGSKVDFNTPVEKIQGAKAESRTLTIHAGWDTDPVQVTYDYNYNVAVWDAPTSGKYANKGQAVDFVTAGSKINQPTGVEDYYQTAADADHGTYTTAKVKGWYSVLDGAPISVVKADTEVYAQWSSAYATLFNANGGFFKSGSNYAWFTRNDGQTWKDVVETPTRDGYDFVAWTVNGIPVNLVTGKTVDGSVSLDDLAAAGAEKVVAAWAPAAANQATALHDRFGLSKYYFSDAVLGYNKDAAVKSLVDAGYTEASAKAYVDAWYNLEDEYFAALAKTDPQSLIDALNALVPKYQAAEKLLVKSDVTVKPSPAVKVPVYRLYNKYITTGTNHLFTTDKGEYDSLVAKGWLGEGEVFQATSDKNATPVYRLYNKYDGSHHYTKDAAERDNLVKLGWTYEFVGFYAPADGDATLYRLYNQYNGEHLFTTDKAENDKLVSLGWTAEESGLKVYSAAK